MGAGTIHVYLALRRAALRVVEGISRGALDAAVMQRVYHDIQEAENQQTSGRRKRSRDGSGSADTAKPCPTIP